MAATDAKLTDSWVGQIDLRLIRESVSTPVFIYSEAQLLRNIGRINEAAKAADLDGRIRLYIPFFPNANPHVLRPLQNVENVGVLLQAPGEYKILARFGFDNFIVSPGHVSDAEIAFWAGLGHPTFLSSLDEVSSWLETGAPSVSVRIDSLDSGKPGVKYSELDRLSDLLARHRRELECLEVYCGSGNSLDEMIDIIEKMFVIFNEHCPNARAVNFAGGHGFVYEEWSEPAKHFNWERYFHALRKKAQELRIPEHVQFLFEPARDVLADAGVLLLSVERDVIGTSVASLVVTDGSRMLMPSAQQRNRRHNVVFLDESMEELPADTRGTGRQAGLRGRSILRHDYILPGEYPVPEGVGGRSYVLIMDVGAYCATQHMEFLNVPPAPEVLIDSTGTPHLITERGDELDKWRHLLPEMEELTR